MYQLDPIANAIIIAEMIIFIFFNSLWINLYFFGRKKKFKKSDETPPVSIIIPAYNKGSVIEKTIRSVLALDYPEKEVIVVNDGSTDNTLKICEKFVKQGKIKLINHRRNRGKAHALNSGIKQAKNDIILTVDADSFPKRNSLKKMVGYFADRKVGAVAGTIKVARPNRLLSIHQCIEYLSQGFQRLCQSFLNAVMVVPGPLALYRKDVLAKAGYFEDDTLVEDFDMTIKIHKAGFKVIAEKDAVCFTEAPQTLRRWWRQRVRWTRGGIQIVKKHHDILFNKNTRGLAFFSFPIHILWTILPWFLLFTFIYNTIPGLFLWFYDLYSTLINFNFSLVTFRSICLFYAAVDEWLVDFFSLNRLNATLTLGYASVCIFLLLVAFTFKSLRERFKPKILKGLALITFYWFILLIVYVHGFLLEIFKRKKVW